MTAIAFAHGLNLGDGFAHSSELNAAGIGAVQPVSTACGGLVQHMLELDEESARSGSGPAVLGQAEELDISNTKWAASENSPSKNSTPNDTARNPCVNA
jgi:hypothetical protein